MLWKLITGIVLVFLIMFSAVLGKGWLTQGSEWDKIARPYEFNITRWEFDNFFNKWEYKLKQICHHQELSESDRIKLVKDYLTRRQEISLESLEDQVEEIIEGQISEVLAQEGLSITFKLGGEAELLFPPLDFEFEELPNLLIISPTHKIEIADTILLRPALSLEEKVDIEGRVEELGFSALVETIGGLATYPSSVPGTLSLQSLLSVIAHEWLHHYFFFHPLGRNFWASGNMTTINETAAGIAGDEIGSLVYRRYYGGEEKEVTPPPEESESVFDFNKEMREIRLAVDEYLAGGEIEEAERYMEEKRRFLEANGYYIRKLNQAYFAFHGRYADRPTSVSPIGGQLRELRERSPSLGNFIMTMSGISSYGELLEMIGE